MLLAEFEDSIEKERIKRKGLWSFNKNLVLVKDLERELQINKINITEASFQIRIYKLPMHTMNEKVGRFFNETIGNIEETDVDRGDAA